MTAAKGKYLSQNNLLNFVGLLVLHYKRGMHRDSLSIVRLPGPHVLETKPTHRDSFSIVRLPGPHVLETKPTQESI